MKVDQPRLTPSNKVISAALSGAVLTIVAWVVKTFAPAVEVPPDVAAAIVTIVSFAVSYMVRDEYVPLPPTEGGMER